MTETYLSGIWAKLASGVTGRSLRARAIRGSALTFLQFGGENILRFASNLILTRLLFPEAFGLMALVMVVLAGVSMFSDIGTNSAIIQNERGDDTVFVNTAWSLQVLRGIVLWLTICLLAQPVATFYTEPLLAIILPVAGLTALIDGFRSTRGDVLTRHLRLGRLTAVNLFVQLVSLLVLAVMAFVMQSVWALVIGNILASAMSVVLSHTALPGQPNRFHIDRESFGILFRFGKFLFLATIAGFLVSQGDRAILGKYVSLGELGVYNVAYFLASVPSLLAGALLGRILFPLYSRLPPWENLDNRRKIARARFLVSGCVFLGAAGLGLSGCLMIELLYDPRYHGAGPTLVLIVAASLPGMIMQSYAPLLLSAGKSDRFALLAVARAVANTGLMLWTIPVFGVAGVPLAMFAAAIAVYPLMLCLILPMRAWDPWHDAIFASFSAALIVLLAWLYPVSFSFLWALVM